MAELPTPTKDAPEPRVITDGVFEEEMYVDAKSAGEFLIALGEQLRDGDEVTITGDGWEIPFPVTGPVELEIEFDGPDDELEIEIELKRRRGSGEAPGVR